MRIGIIGAGIAGLASAWFLQSDHEVTLYDRADFVGGHARTVFVDQDAVAVQAETGFKYFKPESHPYLVALMRVLDLTPREHSATLTVVTGDGRGTLVLPPRSPRHFVQLLGSLRRLRWALALNRFRRSGDDLLAASDSPLSLREFLGKEGFSTEVQEAFLLPLIAASWGTVPADIARFPAYCILTLLHIPPGRASTFLEVEGGVSAYIEALARQLSSVDVRLGAGVASVARQGHGYMVRDGCGDTRSFDRLVLATAPWDAAGLLQSVPGAGPWYGVLSQFRHFDTTIAIHSDPAFMPAHRADWGLINIFLGETGRPWMTEWAGWRQTVPVFRTWLPPGRPLPRNMHHQREFRHLLVTSASWELQARIARLQGQNDIWVAGTYSTGPDNHESALQSAIRVGEALAPLSPNLRKLQTAAGKAPLRSRAVAGLG